MASRNGLNPKIKAPKGIGFGRALPAPFGFDKGFKPDGIDDYFTIPNLVGKMITNPVTIELWTKPISKVTCSWCGFKVTYAAFNMRLNLDIRGISTHGGGINNEIIPVYNGLKYHVVGYFDPIGLAVGQIANANPSGFEILSGLADLSLFTNSPLANVFVGCDVSTTEPSPHLMDEFRLYNGIMPYSQVVQNYNNGIGQNPGITEDLFCWYKFEAFEMLDFSPAQDGSDIRLGIRDLSGKNNHGYPNNMDTDPVSSTYVLKTF